MLYRIVTVSNQCWIRDWGSYGTTWNFKLPSYLKVCTMRYARHPFDIFIPADIIFNHSSLQFSCSDCFFHSSELHFAQADYLQALEMDPENQAVKSRLSIVYNEFGILDYYDRHYLESIDHLTAAIRFNPRIAAYYLSRARARYMIEVRERLRPFCVTQYPMQLRGLNVAFFHTGYRRRQKRRAHVCLPGPRQQGTPLDIFTTVSWKNSKWRHEEPFGKSRCTCSRGYN